MNFCNNKEPLQFISGTICLIAVILDFFLALNTGLVQNIILQPVLESYNIFNIIAIFFDILEKSNIISSHV